MKYPSAAFQKHPIARSAPIGVFMNDDESPHMLTTDEARALRDSLARAIDAAEKAEQ